MCLTLRRKDSQRFGVAWIKGEGLRDRHLRAVAGVLHPAAHDVCPSPSRRWDSGPTRVSGLPSFPFAAPMTAQPVSGARYRKWLIRDLLVEGHAVISQRHDGDISLARSRDGTVMQT